MSQEDLILNVSITKWQKHRRKCCVHQNQNSSHKKNTLLESFTVLLQLDIIYKVRKNSYKNSTTFTASWKRNGFHLLWYYSKNYILWACFLQVHSANGGASSNRTHNSNNTSVHSTVSDKNLDKLSWSDKNKRATYSFSTILQTFDEMETETAPTEEGATEENP